eukprot:6889415-Pyramimonas_sp.AAC.1
MGKKPAQPKGHGPPIMVALKVKSRAKAKAQTQAQAARLSPPPAETQLYASPMGDTQEYAPAATSSASASSTAPTAEA